ncbi:hypothetical protein [Flavilitoribacter nigricans]|uniref:DUF1801 domain-containing protein n=1 Tax=Flavilitoribacter nigricans (strain ATCC 23147 / DSM 23189 / NBRC 102662 / NCIMB 1420 / SS-2) TaxID=1122177 RepID=A0A2D0N4D2_FLAN2|nr:hypothetical protein [Flavilitoribacter nigricans]PHN03260.1 hypothetical protein CRP01_28105 [Flavilitoribacter nigricans DSM 23189 = NBRC 102662]
MVTDLQEIESTLKNIMLECVPPLQVRKETPTLLELAGTRPAMQGKQKVDGFYFGSVVPKPKDIRLYFFPIYTHVDAFEDIPEGVRKCLKGKSCFHIKKLDEELERAFREMVQRGLELYRKDDLV